MKINEKSLKYTAALRSNHVQTLNEFEKSEQEFRVMIYLSWFNR